MRGMRITAFLCGASLLVSACGGGGGGGSGSGNGGGGPTTPPSNDPYTAPAQEALSAADVEGVLARAVEEATARNRPAVIAVTDRVGNVLAVYAMAGAPLTLSIRSPADRGPVIPGDAEGLDVPVDGAIAAGAIAKAITGAYLSSSGNAFTTRTASQIVQQHFPPAPSTVGLESGPLFGVQFSQLPCSDLAARFNGTASADSFIGPKRSPLGLAADPGGMPLYKNGVVVGGIGVMSDPLYSYDANTLDMDADADEFIALAGQSGFAPADAIRADRIAVDGSSLRYADATATGLLKQPSAARPLAQLNAAGLGGLIAINGYFDGMIRAGQAYGTEASGIRAATAAERSSGSTIDDKAAFILTDGSGANRFPIRAGTDGVSQPLTAAEVRALLTQAFTVMTRARAQIRRPLESRAQVTISVVDTDGAPLGIVRSPDAPVFGTDVALQKARTAAFFSGPHAAGDLLGNPSADVQGNVARARAFFGDPTALTGKLAMGDRTVGNLSRPYFPDGEVGTSPGPFSRPITGWSPFNTGLQSALIIGNILEHVNFVLGASATDTPRRCTLTPDAAPGRNRLQNGIQIFPGSVPIFRGGVLVGAIGVSGDGIDQDDMIAFLGAHQAGLQLGGFGNADPARRSDQVQISLANGRSVRLRYIACPFAPFLDTSDQNVCSGK
ncbi:MAG: heme-binding protein [Sphingomonas sp.]|nr:heme-binding protein [Sphingomonas sp.]MDX3884951.1 heme-binding protein [Sphingomonas sp.]